MVGMNFGEGWLVVREGFNQEVTCKGGVLKALQGVFQLGRVGQVIPCGGWRLCTGRGSMGGSALLVMAVARERGFFVPLGTS